MTPLTLAIFASETVARAANLQLGYGSGMEFMLALSNIAWVAGPNFHEFCGRHEEEFATEGGN